MAADGRGLIETGLSRRLDGPNEPRYLRTFDVPIEN
jgi:hypothetical protein